MEKERKLSKQETIKLMQKIINSLKKDKPIQLQVDHTRFTIKPDDFSIEIEQSKGEKELEINFKKNK